MITINRDEILRLLKGETVSKFADNMTINITLNPTDIPRIPDGLEVRTIIVNEIVRCNHGDDGMCEHPVLEGETKPCDVSKCPMFTENERNIREEDSRHRLCGECIDEQGRITRIGRK